MQLELSTEQEAFLVRLLKDYGSTVRAEIEASDTPALRRALRREEGLVRELLVTLGELQVTVD